jgi:hypothetical protein
MAHTSDCCTMGVSLMALATKATTKGADLSTQGAGNHQENRNKTTEAKSHGEVG